MDRLFELEKDGWWVQVSPLAEKGKWVCGIYKKGKKYWVTEVCQSEFATAQEAYEWAFSAIKEQNHYKQ
jgi:hypothetical protein